MTRATAATAAGRTPTTASGSSVTAGTTTTEAARARTAAKAVRVGAVALTGVLTLTACGGGGSDTGPEDGSGRGGASPTPSRPTATESGSGSGSGSGANTKASGLNGSWLATTDGRAVVLIVTGEQAALFSTDRTTCTGTAVEQDGRQVLRLAECKARTTGTVDSVNKTTLRVTWEGGPGTETYTRAEGGTLPSGLATASLGS
ncbi:hypothetical protein ACF061_11220 [Streptomyces sp. NPDC015220]|uniref:hypothetical protein n=1 Tax=Streptomyces sp. NPDC015220 TaxID=3364947 RepID=UPI003701AAE1